MKREYNDLSLEEKRELYFQNALSSIYYVIPITAFLILIVLQISNKITTASIVAIIMYLLVWLVDIIRLNKLYGM